MDDLIVALANIYDSVFNSTMECVFGSTMKRIDFELIDLVQQ